ncbi:MAG: hypothetical protein IKV80_08330 [Bacteroidales bacterium]|nr:hypothetical protein [Bacteroidales bacterium]
MSIYEGLTEFLLPKVTQLFEQYIYFNTALPSSVGIMTDSMYRESEFIDGSCGKSMMFTMRASLPYSEERDGENMSNLAIFDEFASWIESQEDQGNYPTLGDNITVFQIEVNRETPTFVSISEDGTEAEYSFGIEITYLEE